MVRSFGDSSKGNMSLLALGVIAVAAFIIGGIVDYMSLTNQQQDLQGVADHAAVAAAQELMVAKGSDERVNSVATSFVNANYTKKAHKTKAVITEKGKAVVVTVT